MSWLPLELAQVKTKCQFLILSPTGGTELLEHEGLKSFFCTWENWIPVICLGHSVAEQATFYYSKSLPSLPAGMHSACCLASTSSTLPWAHPSLEPGNSRQASHATAQRFIQTSVFHYCLSLKNIVSRFFFFNVYIKAYVRGSLNFEKCLLPSGAPFLLTKKIYTVLLGWLCNWHAGEMKI